MTMTDQYDINPAGSYKQNDWHAMYADLLSAYRALLARAEAAEAERDEWKAAYADNELYCLAVMQRRDELAARVAELEAALVSRSELDSGPFNTLVRTIANRNWLSARVAELEAQLAAAHLNPYNTAPLAEHVIVTLRTEGWRDEDGLWDWDDYGDWDVVGWQPLPPAPDTEPTP